MINHIDISNTDLRAKIKAAFICFGGNKKLKIYGHLDCKSGKRMKRKNRVFFTTEQEAQQFHYRPCGHCMREKYKKWKSNLV